MVSARTVQPHRVRVYGSGAWAVRSDLEFTGGSEGAGQIMGEFTLLSRFGTAPLPPSGIFVVAEGGRPHSGKRFFNLKATPMRNTFSSVWGYQMNQEQT